MHALLQDPPLAPYACKASESRGRLIAEPPSATRTSFQRDRDRIIHSGAFRKMRNKTQVFIENEGDYYRTRLTHSLEVAQIARAIARALRLNEDLAETLALAHDLGHTCFGHAGEEALDAMMQPYGGFRHNDQTFRILTELERHYLTFDGLNLTWETLEGIAKHNGPVAPGGSAVLEAFSARWDLELSTFASAEAQVAGLADDIAYNTHDMDDGYRAGFFSFDDLQALPLFGETLGKVHSAAPQAPHDRIMHEVVRQVIGLMVEDLLATTRANLSCLKPEAPAAIRHAAEPVVSFSSAMQAHIKALRHFLFTRLYRHVRVNRVTSQAKSMVKDLFTAYMTSPTCLPPSWQESFRTLPDDRTKARLIADYIAGMTDRYAVQEHKRLFAVEATL